MSNNEQQVTMKRPRISIVCDTKLLFVFGEKRTQVITVTNDDYVYAFGDNSKNGCLGVGHTHTVPQPTLIKELCHRQVISIELSANYDLVLALTKTGAVYSWGSNAWGRLGNGVKVLPQQFTPLVIDSLSEKNVVDVKACNTFALALTATGEVYGWGRHCRYTPAIMRVTRSSNDQKVVSIACGALHALALTEHGDVYSFGSDSYGQRGMMSLPYDDRKWSHVITSRRICKISCGPQHSLLLSSDRSVHCFGSNNFGQCGDGTRVDKYQPTKVTCNATFIDIASAKDSNISVCLAADGLCYVWGECGEESVKQPTQTIYDDMSEFLNHHSMKRKLQIEPKFLHESIAKVIKYCTLFFFTLYWLALILIVFTYDLPKATTVPETTTFECEMPAENFVINASLLINDF